MKFRALYSFILQRFISRFYLFVYPYMAMEGLIII